MSRWNCARRARQLHAPPAPIIIRRDIGPRHQTLEDRPVGLGLRDDLLPAEHPRVRDGAGDVLPGEPAVEGDGLGEGFDQPLGAFIVETILPVLDLYVLGAPSASSSGAAGASGLGSSFCSGFSPPEEAPSL